MAARTANFDGVASQLTSMGVTGVAYAQLPFVPTFHGDA